MPEVPGWEVASYYSPSGRTEVGGDFYDAMPIGGGRLALFVGDVMGRGVAAAAAMAQMRAAVRAYAAVEPWPEAVLRNLDLMFARYGTEQLVTLVYMVLNPRTDELVVANAGHPPPVILRGDRSTEQLPLADGAPLGAGPQRRRQVRVPLRAGDTLLAFTDGLIERRDEDIDHGLQRVHDALSHLARADLSASLTRPGAHAARTLPGRRRGGAHGATHALTASADPAAAARVETLTPRQDACGATASTTGSLAVRTCGLPGLATCGAPRVLEVCEQVPRRVCCLTGDALLLDASENGQVVHGVLLVSGDGLRVELGSSLLLPRPRAARRGRGRTEEARGSSLPA